MAVGPGARRHHRAGPLPLPVPRRGRAPPGDLARLPAPRRRAGAASAGPTARTHPLHGDARRRHDHRPRDGLLPGDRGARRRAACRRARRRCAASRWSWSGWPTTSATWARWPATSASCRPPSYCGRIRGDFLNLTALLCGSRFGRGLVRPGGVALRRRRRRASSELLRRLDATLERRRGGRRAALGARPRCMARFEDTGRVSRATSPTSSAWSARRRGPAALERDVRHDLPSGIYRFAQIPVSHLAHRRRLRPRLRALAGDPALASRSSREQLAALPAGADRAPPVRRSRRTRLVVVAGRGLARRDLPRGHDRRATGRFARYKVVDPSFHNWFGLALALRDQQISDFPLCNKSFNLSYCGHDL